MVHAEKAPREVDNCRHLLSGVAKNLADRCYGPDGPCWGTPFSALEDVALRLAQSIRKAFLDLALSRQADAFLRNPPAPLCLCPACGLDTSAKDPEPRLLFCRAATVEWLEPQRYCSKCRKAFSPQSKSLGIDAGGHYSTSVLDLVCYAGANKPSFREASSDLDKFSGLAVHEKQVERLCKRIGAERLAERDEQLASFLALPLSRRKDGAPDDVTPPDDGQVAVVMTDAGMLQLRDEGGEEEEEEEDHDADEKPSGRHWHEKKVGLVLLMQSKRSDADPCPEIPDTFVDAERVGRIVRGLKKSAALRAEDEQEQAEAIDQPDDDQRVLDDEDEEEEAYEGPKLKRRQVVASRQGWPSFGALLACAAWLAGFAKAERKAFVADGAKAIWGVWQARFSAYVPILDFIHAMSYVYAAAEAIGGQQQEQAGDGWRLYAEWIRWTWQGKVGLVIEKLREWQRANGEPGKGETETSARWVVARALGYLGNNKGRMRYDEYRKQGLPLVSSLMESMVKQMGRRVKGTEKFWTDEGAEAILQLRADYLSDGDVMARFWQRRQAKATGQRSYRPRS
jgi:hypothetical protein